MNNCFSIISKEECEKCEENLANHEKQMSLSYNHRARDDYNAELL